MGGKMEGFWSVGVGVLLVIVAGLLSGVEGRASAQCVQMGQAADNWYARVRGNVGYTIGGKLMRPRFPEALDFFPFNNLANDPKTVEEFLHQNDGDYSQQTCPKAYIIKTFHLTNDINDKRYQKSVHHPRVDYCTKKMDIRVYAVQQFGVTLRGWLFVEVDFDGTIDRKWTGYEGNGGDPSPTKSTYNVATKDDELEWIYVQVRDENFNAVGEFVSSGEIGKADRCVPSDPALIYPTDYQLLPCSATGFREAKTSQALFMAKQRQYKLRDGDKLSDPDIARYLPEKKDLKKGIYFLWRLNEYWCNRHEKFRIDVTAWSSKNEDTYYQSSFGGDTPQCSEPYIQSYKDGKAGTGYDEFNNNLAKEGWKTMGLCRVMDKRTGWFKPKWFGAADIRTPGEPLDCSKKIYKLNGEIPEHSRNWLKETVAPVKVVEDFISNKEKRARLKDVYKGSTSEEEYRRFPFKVQPGKDVRVPTVQGCQVNPYVDELAGQASGADIVTFGGRCKGYLTKAADHLQYQGCERDEKLPQYKSFEEEHSTWTSYKSYTEDIGTGRLKACSVDCPELNASHVAEIGKINITSGENGTTGNEVVINQYPVKGKVLLDARKTIRETTFWQVRKYHGNLCIFFTMFIMPVSLFVTRYYKETFMHGRCASCPPWLWVHLFMCISVLTLFRSTFSAMRETIYSWGRQLDGDSNAHRALGYAFVGMFGLMTAIGGLRPIPRIPRLITCGMHSVVGFVLYLIALGLIMHSPRIPGSPSVDYCIDESANNSNRTDPRDITHRVTIYAVVWLVLDIIFHAALTIFQVIVDKQTGIERPGFGLPFIPFLPPNANRDYQGALVRKIVLVVYIIVSFIMTVVTMADIFDNDLDNPSGDHKFCKPWNVTTCNIKDNPFGCTELQKQYYNIVIQRYNITWDD